MKASHLTATIGALLIAASAIVTGCALPTETEEALGSSEDGLQRSQLTARAAAAILAALEGADPDSYRITLPVFRGAIPVGQQTYGTLALSQVREIASQQSINVKADGNVQAVWRADDASCGGGGGGGGGGDKNGPNSHYTTQTFNFEQLRTLLRSLDANSFQFVEGVRRGN